MQHAGTVTTNSAGAGADPGACVCQAEPQSAPLKVTVKKWHAFAAWTWNAGDDVCGICRMPFESAAPDTKYPGDDSPVVWGTCAHAFHLQCITKWLNSHNEQRCPICRRAWEFKNDVAETAAAAAPAR